MPISRRHFLSGTGMLAGSALALTAPPVERLVTAMLKNALNVANADSGVGNYILISTYGAPGRWVFDQTLNPNGEAVQASAMASNVFTVGANGTVSGSSYSTMVYKGKHFSPLFGTQVATGGGQRPLSDLLDNMIVIRGYGTGTDGHPTNLARQVNPISTTGSVSGVVADHSNALFKAIQFPTLGSASGYSSIMGSGLTLPNYVGDGPHVNYISQLLNPFGLRAEPTDILKVRSRYEDLIERAKKILSDDQSSHRAEFASISADQELALQKIKQGIGNLVDQWPALYNKYLTILSWPFKDRSAVGYTANPVVPPAEMLPHWAVMIDQGNRYAAPNQDLRDWAVNADLSRQATTFALCEFMILQGLTNAYELTITEPTNLMALTMETASSPVLQAPTRLIFDQHATGVMSAIYLNSCLYRGIGGAILELIAQLKSQAMFDKTVIHWTQEFARSAREDGTGADHGFDSMISSIITGKNTNGPIVVGNILASGTAGGLPPHYSNCYGYKAPTVVNGKTVSLNPAHVTSSLAVLLGLPTNPWVNVAEPLITLDSSGVKAATTAQLV